MGLLLTLGWSLVLSHLGVTYKMAVLIVLLSLMSRVVRVRCVAQGLPHGMCPVCGQSSCCRNFIHPFLREIPLKP